MDYEGFFKQRLDALRAPCAKNKEGSNMTRFVGFIAATVVFFTISSIAHAQYDEPALGTGTKTVEIVIENEIGRAHV